MKNNEAIKKELEELSPLLSKIKAQESKMEVPENYFDALPDQIWEQIKLMPQPERAKPSISWWAKLQAGMQNLWQPRLAVGLATFAVLIVAGIYFLQPNDTTDPFDQLTAEEVTAYMSQNVEEFDAAMLVDAMGDNVNVGILSSSDFDDAEIEQLLNKVIEEMDEASIEDLL